MWLNSLYNVGYFVRIIIIRMAVSWARERMMAFAADLCYCNLWLRG